MDSHRTTRRIPVDTCTINVGRRLERGSPWRRQARKPASHWGAVAISPDDKVYGTAQGFSTQGDAERAAVNECKDRHGRSCSVAASGADKCFAVVSQAEGAPIAAANANITDAGNQALAICNGGRPNVVVCTMLTSFCTDEHPQAVIEGPEGDDREKPISK